MAGSGAFGLFAIAVEPHNDQYDPDDDRWRDQIATLYQDLHSQVDVVAAGGRPVPGAKGAVDHLTIALSSAGAFQAAVVCFRAWLGRDRDRRIELKWDEDGTEHAVTLTGQAVDAKAIREMAIAATSRSGGPPWPSGTEQS